jgi:hypothetical protein
MNCHEYTCIGYLKPIEAAKYVEGLPNLRGMVVGVSKEHHARDTLIYFEKIAKKLKVSNLLWRFGNLLGLLSVAVFCVFLFCCSFLFLALMV